MNAGLHISDDNDGWTAPKWLLQLLSFMHCFNVNSILRAEHTNLYEKLIEWFHLSGMRRNSIHNNALTRKSLRSKLAFHNFTVRGELVHHLKTFLFPLKSIQLGLDDHLFFLRVKAVESDRIFRLADSILVGEMPLGRPGSEYVVRRFLQYGAFLWPPRYLCGWMLQGALCFETGFYGN